MDPPYDLTRYGDSTLRKLYLRLGQVTEEIYTVDEQEKPFRSVLRESTAEFQRRLEMYIGQRH